MPRAATGSITLVELNDGFVGADGFNNAVVSVYKRKSGTAPTDAPTAVGTYTFSTAGLVFAGGTPAVSNGWHTTIDAATGTDQLYIRSATAVSRDATDTIAVSEWSGVVQAGVVGADGLDGLSNAVALYYQRTNSATAPTSLPNVSATFNLGTGVLTPATNNVWQTLETISTTGKYLWFTSAAASSRTATDTVATGEWATALLLSSDGDDGSAGANAQTLVLSADSQVYTFNASGSLDPSSQTITFTAKLQNIASNATFTSSPTVGLVGSGNTRTLTGTAFGSNTSVTVTATVGSISDSVTVHKLSDGSIGVDGQSAYTVFQSNEAHVIPADNDGGNPVFTGSGTSISAFYGTVALSFINNANPGTNQFNVSIANGTGVSGPSGLQSSATVGAITGLTNDSGTRTITVEVEGPSGTTEQSFTITQSFSKSKTGAGGVGSDGSRGAGRFERSFTLTGTAFPTVGTSSSTIFNNNARQTICEALQATWITSCNLASGNPVKGDIIIITYTNSVGVTATKAAIHDGTGVANTDWTTFNVQIDGSLLVTGTVVASAINIDDTITLADSTSGLRSVKNSLFDFAQAGIYVGNSLDPDNNPVSGILAGDLDSYIQMLSTGSVRLSNVDFFAGATAGENSDYNTAGTYTVDLTNVAVGTVVTWTVVGGGGGGASNKGSVTTYTQSAGTDGLLGTADDTYVADTPTTYVGEAGVTGSSSTLTVTRNSSSVSIRTSTGGTGGVVFTGTDGAGSTTGTSGTNGRGSGGTGGTTAAPRGLNGGSTSGGGGGGGQDNGPAVGGLTGTNPPNPNPLIRIDAGGGGSAGTSATGTYTTVTGDTALILTVGAGGEGGFDTGAEDDVAPVGGVDGSGGIGGPGFIRIALNAGGSGISILEMDSDEIRAGVNVSITGTLTADEVVDRSDIRLKTKIESIRDALQTVKKLEGVLYTRESTSREEMGVIAQQIQKHVPQVVSEAADGMLQVNYGRLCGLLIEAVKELSEEIYQMHESFGRMGRRITKLEQMLSDEDDDE